MSEPNPNTLLFDAAIFDVDRTICDVGTKTIPLTPTLVATLQNLKAQGVQLFALSNYADKLDQMGFPPGLFIPQLVGGSGEKSVALATLLHRHKLTHERVAYFGDDNETDGNPARHYSLNFVLVNSRDSGGPTGLEARIEEFFGQGIVVRPSPKAIIFDVGETIYSEHQGRIRTKTLLQTLKNLRSKGIFLLTASTLSSQLPEFGFPVGLIEPVHTLFGKGAGYDIFLKKYDLTPSDVIVIGDDDSRSDSDPARERGMPFILVEEIRYCRTIEDLNEVETALATYFGADVVAKPEEPKKKRVVSDLPKPLWRERHPVLAKWVGLGPKKLTH
ncbi:MAG: HAD family hydrolase [Candidatus Micrarchaeia archaeon]|jgi:FMN phosphatase YigB (HAD superfamily)